MNLIFATATLTALLTLGSQSLVPYLPVQHDATVMLVTGSTNTLGFRIVVQRDGKAEYVKGSNRAKARLDAQLTKQLFTDLEAGMPLSALPVQRCMKSASFGTSTYVYWRHTRSHDVSCPGNAEAKVINADVQRVANELKLT